MTEKETRRPGNADVHKLWRQKYFFIPATRGGFGEKHEFWRKKRDDTAIFSSIEMIPLQFDI